MIANNGNYTWETCLASYKEEKGLIERGFDILKNDLEFTTPHIRKDETHIKNNSFKKMVIQFEKLKAIVLEDGQIIYSELTKKQKELLQPFDAVPKY